MNLIKIFSEWFIRLAGIVEQWAQLPPEVQAELKLMVAIFLGNIAVSAVGTVLAGLIIYWIVHRHQTRTMEEERELNRLSLLGTLEDEINELYKSRNVVYSEDPHPGDDIYHMGTCFNPVYNWNEEYTDDELESVMINGQRYWNVSRKDDIWLASSAFQDSLLWFRKLYRVYNQDLIEGADLYVLWRHIVPFVLGNHYRAFELFFSETDLEPLRDMAVEMTDYAHRNGKSELFAHYSGELSNQSIDPKFERRVDDYFQERFDRCIDELISHHVTRSDLDDFSEVPEGARAEKGS